MIEAKATHTVTPDLARGLERLGAAFRRRHRQQDVALHLVHRQPSAGLTTTALAPGVAARDWRSVGQA